MKGAIVISLGGSLISKDKESLKRLNKFKEIILKNSKNLNFIVVCGGGKIARKRIEALKKEGKNEYYQSLAGMEMTKINAKNMIKIFGKYANDSLPKNYREIKKLLDKDKIVFLGSLKFKLGETSDATAARLAHKFKTSLINITNVGGLYDKNPSKYDSAKLVKKISWKDFQKKALSIPYHPGQHFVLDQMSAKIINKKKIRTYIIGKNLTNLENIIKNKKFTGTLIEK